MAHVNTLGSRVKLFFHPERLVLAAVALVCSSAPASCAGKATWIPLDHAQLDSGVRAKTAATLYELSYGQVRYMNAAAIIAGAAANVAGGVANGTNGGRARVVTKAVDMVAQGVAAAADYMAVADARQSSSDFETKMGDFDVFACFAERLYGRRNDVRYFDIDVVHNEVDHNAIINRLIASKPTDAQDSGQKSLRRRGARYVSAFKFQYGIGARVGNEQFGFTKTYRPYVRIVGLVKDAETDRFVWGHKVILFSNTGFQGKDEAQSAPREQLIEEFKLLTAQLADLTVRDLNGERYTSEDLLVDYDPNTDDVLSF